MDGLQDVEMRLNKNKRGQDVQNMPKSDLDKLINQAARVSKTIREKIKAVGGVDDGAGVEYNGKPRNIRERETGMTVRDGEHDGHSVGEGTGRKALVQEGTVGR